ncbi:LPXTG cell wall anchor domain-containing protein [Streptomyces sioyaensis]|uniref:LPXTG cell wall anchor domain-containing protein n=1 Tax=Streptomyces sioyaensis TaxID=67364 RepID=UPI003669C145
MKSTRISRTAAGSRPYAVRPLPRGAAGAGLLAALALATLSAVGTAHADDRAPKPQHPHTGQASSTPAPRPTESSATPGPSTSDAPTAPPSGTPTALPSGTPTAPPSSSPTAPPSASPRPSVTTTHPGTPAASAPAKGRGSDRELAHTGASSTAAMALGGSAAALIAAGGGTVYAVRRRRG